MVEHGLGAGGMMVLAPIGVPRGIDLMSEEGLATAIARGIHRLLELPFSVHVANSLAQLAPVQLKVLDAGDVRDELDELREKVAALAGPRPVAAANDFDDDDDDDDESEEEEDSDDQAGEHAA